LQSPLDAHDTGSQLPLHLHVSVTHHIEAPGAQHVQCPGVHWAVTPPHAPHALHAPYEQAAEHVRVRV
jgi:hypothetical protein